MFSQSGKNVASVPGICTFPCTTACSPYTMTLPGADTMNEGIIGVDCLRVNCAGLSWEEVPLEGGSSTGDMAATGEDSGV